MGEIVVAEKTAMPTSEQNITKLPQYSHEDIVSYPRLFWTTLESLHHGLGTKISVAVIGGKELDLHILYGEVTKRGGFHKVVEEKKWREISSIFKFPDTATSASYVLRKNYLNNLYYYEQIYFSKQRKSHVIPPQAITPVSVAYPVENTSCTPAITGHGVPVTDPLVKGPPQAKVAGGSRGSTVLGAIHGKFENGYLVSVKIGSETLQGVLYHPATTEHSSPAPAGTSAIVPYSSEPSTSRRRRRRRRKLGDPDRPRSTRSAYNFFFSAKRNELKKLYPYNEEKEFTRMIGHAWRVITDPEKQLYQEIGNKDRERYQKELKAYKEGKQLLQAFKES